MIIVQDLTFRESLFSGTLETSANPTSQTIYWEVIVLSIFGVFVVFNIYGLYDSLESEEENSSIRSIQIFYLCVLVSFVFTFYVFLISSLFATYLVDFDICVIFKWIEFISCIITAFFCFVVHIVYFVYKYKSKNMNDQLIEELSMGDDKLKANDIQEVIDPNIVGRISEMIMFALFQFIMVQILSNLLYFNVTLNLCVNVVLIISLQAALVYFSDIGGDIIGTISIVLVVLLYFIQIHKSTIVAKNINSLLDTISNISFVNADLEKSNLLLTTNLNDVSTSLSAMSQSLGGVQSQLSSALLDNNNMQNSLNSLNASSDQLTFKNASLSAYQIQSLTNQLNMNIKMLQNHISYLNQLQALFAQLQQQFITDSPDITGNNLYVGYAATIGALSTQVNTLLTSAQSLLSNVNTVQASDIATFNSNLNALITSVNFIRSHVFFTVPSSIQGQDSANFNLLYEFGFKVFAHFFRNKYSSFIPWNNSNENVVRDTIMYIKKTPAIYSALSVYSQGIASELYELMDGDTVWGLLNGNLNNDNNTTQMNNNILTNSQYSQIYNNGGIEYCTLLFSLASQPEFFTTFDNSATQQSFSWQLFPLILEYMQAFSDSSFGSTAIQSM